jgi:hypothetical protein
MVGLNPVISSDLFQLVAVLKRQLLSGFDFTIPFSALAGCFL